jgi:hypothetical protein
MTQKNFTITMAATLHSFSQWFLNRQTWLNTEESSLPGCYTVWLGEWLGEWLRECLGEWFPELTAPHSSETSGLHISKHGIILQNTCENPKRCRSCSGTSHMQNTRRIFWKNFLTFLIQLKISHIFSVHCMSVEQLYRTDNLIKCLNKATRH